MQLEDEADLWNCLSENECRESTLSKWGVADDIARMELKNTQNKLFQTPKYPSNAKDLV